MNNKKYTKKQIAATIGVITAGVAATIISRTIIKKAMVNKIGEILDIDDAKHMTFEELKNFENDTEED